MQVAIEATTGTDPPSAFVFIFFRSVGPFLRRSPRNNKLSWSGLTLEYFNNTHIKRQQYGFFFEGRIILNPSQTKAKPKQNETSYNTTINNYGEISTFIWGVFASA